MVVILSPEDEPTYPEYQQLAAAAQRQARINWTVDPANMWPEDTAIARRGADWAQAVLGFAYGRRNVTRWHQELLLLADQHDVTPPLPEHIVAVREEQERVRQEKEAASARWYAARDAEWAALAKAFPVKVEVVHNYQSARHCENGYVQGADHILVQEPLQHGRLARLTGQGLCETNSRRKGLYFPYREGDSASRIPTCKACIKSACKITGLTAPIMLGAPSANGGGGIPNRVWKAKTLRGRRWPK